MKQYWTNSERKMYEIQAQTKKCVSLPMTQMSKANYSIKWPANLVAAVNNEIQVIKMENLIRAMIQTHKKGVTLEKIVKYQLYSLLKKMVVVFTLKANRKILKLRFLKVQIILNHQVDLPLIH